MRPLTLTRRAAAGYYERKNYTDDKMAALHAKIVPAMNARELLARFRTLRERIEKKDACSADFQNVIGQYNAAAGWTNSSLR